MGDDKLRSELGNSCTIPDAPTSNGYLTKITEEVTQLKN